MPRPRWRASASPRWIGQGLGVKLDALEVGVAGGGGGAAGQVLGGALAGTKPCCNR